MKLLANKVIDVLKQVAKGSPLIAHKKSLLAWCLYDWASSAFPTVIVTFIFAAYFTQAIAASPEEGTSLWGGAMALSGLAIAILSPIFGAVADQSGRRRPWLISFTLLCLIASASLWFITPEAHWLIPALILAGLANFAFEIAMVFYNALLPELASRERIGRISGYAWGLGYAGGIVCLVICLVLFVRPDPALFGLDREAAEHVRITGPFVGLWYLLFALPLFWVLKEPAKSGRAFSEQVRKGLSALWQTFKSFRTAPLIPKYLVARMFYIDGLNTLFAFGGIYAAGTLGLTFEEILIFGIILNVTGGIGAAALGWLDDRVGARPTILISLVALFGLGTAILVVSDKTTFFVLGALIGIFVGPVQSSSRSLMARLAPENLRNEMFGLYALSGRITAFLGPALVAVITAYSGSQRWGMSAILVLFALGGFLLWRLKLPSDL